MPSLNECMEKIRKLVKAKGHEDELKDVPLKLLFAVVEISEAVDLWKKWGWNGEYNINRICEEIIDAIFYLLDAYGILCREFKGTVSPDEMFTKKLEKNWNRGWRYGRPDSGYTLTYKFQNKENFPVTEPSNIINVGWKEDEDRDRQEDS